MSRSWQSWRLRTGSIGVLFLLASASVWGQSDLPFLQPVQTIVDGEGGLQGLGRAWSVTVSSDGQHVYTAAPGDDAIAHWAWSEGGQLRQVGLYRPDRLELEALDGVFMVDLPPDGKNLYAVTSQLTVLVFARDPSTGSLELLETIREIEGLPVLGILQDVAVSPDGGTVYVLSYFGLIAFSREPGTGRLVSPRRYPGFDSPEGRHSFHESWNLATSPDGRNVYVTSRRSGVIVLRVASEGGDLEFVESVRQVSPFAHPLHLVVSPDGRNVYGVNIDSDVETALIVYDRDAESGALALQSFCCSGLEQDLAFLGTADLAISADGRDLYATWVQEGSLSHFRRDRETGSLTHGARYQDDPEGHPGFGGPSAVALSPDEEFLYLTSSEDSALHVFSRQTSGGSLSPLQALRDGAGVEVAGFTDIRHASFSPDGRFFYAVSAAKDGLAIFRFADGELSPVGSFLPGKPEDFVAPRSLAFSPDGRFLVLVSRGKRPALYTVDEDTGGLSFASEFETTGHPIEKAVFSLDGKNVYSISVTLGILVYSLDPVTGQSELLEVVGSGFINDHGYRVDPFNIIFSADGGHVYVAGYGHFWTFERNLEEGGRLRPLSAQETLPGDHYPAAIALMAGSADGRNLYMQVRGTVPSLYSYRRNLLTGELSFLDSYPVDLPDTSFFGTLQDLRVSPDGLHVFLSDSGSDSLLTFVRNPSTGRLTRLEEQRSGVGGLRGFLNPKAITVSPDSSRIVVASDLGLHVFGKREIECPVDDGGLCLNEDRFVVELDWERPNGLTGIGHALPSRSDDSGLFWFFDEENWEMLFKVLDGCNFNSKFWVFSAATTNVEYTLRVTDRLTGLKKSYTNPQGTSANALTDTLAFAACPLPGAASGSQVQGEAFRKIDPRPSLPLSQACGTGDGLCLNDDRFQVEVDWRRRNGRRGTGKAVSFGSPDSGLLWFFDDANWEMLVKVLDGCGNNGHFWVFSAATTDVEYTLRVTDTQTGKVKEYFNPLGTSAAAITDTRAFATCPDPK